MFRLNCIGPLTLSDSQVVYKTKRKKSLVLLAFLVLKGGKRSRLNCASFFWPENDEKHALANLRNAISEVNHLCGTRLILSEGDLVFAHGDIETDAGEIFRIQDMLDKNQPVDFEFCLDILKSARGEFLAGYSISSSPEFDDWHYNTCSRIASALDTIRKRAILYLILNKRYIEALGEAQINREENPFDGMNHRIVMLVYAFLGDMKGIRDQYEYGRKWDGEDSPAEIETVQLFDFLKSRESRGESSLLLERLREEMGSIALPGEEKGRRKPEKRFHGLRRFKLPGHPFWPILATGFLAVMLLIQVLHGRVGALAPEIAVLPFQAEGVSDDKATEMLIGHLKALGGLRVSPYSRVRKYRDRFGSIVDISREINAHYLIRGHLSPGEGCTWIRLRLFDGKTGELIRYFVYEETDGRLDQAVARLAGELKDTILSGIGPAQREKIDREDLAGLPVSSPAIYADRYHMEPDLTEVEINRLYQFLRECYSHDLYAVQDYLRKTDLYWGSAFFGRMPPDGAVELMETAERLYLDKKPDSPLIDLGRGVRALVYEGDVRRAEEHFKRAAEMDCRDPSLFRWMAVLEIAKGAPEEAFDHLYLAGESDPLNHLNHLYLATALYYNGSYSRAVDMVEYYQGHRAFPHGYAELIRGMALLAEGETEGAVDTFNRCLTLNGGALAIAYQGFVLARTGRRDMAEEILREISSNMVPDRSVSAMKAIVAAGLRKEGLAGELLEQARITREVPYLWIRHDPFLFQGVSSLTAAPPPPEKD